MAKKTWTVTTDEGTYTVDLNGSKISINGGAPEKLNKLAKKTHFVDTEYTVPLGNRVATLFIQSLAAPVLSYNGVDCATGNPWTYEKIPVWSIILMILDFVLGGVIWGLLGTIVTAVIVRSSLNKGVKIVLSLVVTAAVFGIGYALGAALNAL